MSPALSQRVHSLWSFPRVSGDEPASQEVADLGESFSPRERG